MPACSWWARPLGGSQGSALPAVISAPVIQVALIQAASLGVAKPCATEPLAYLHPPSLGRVAAGPWLTGLPLGRAARQRPAERTWLEAGTASFPPRGTEAPPSAGLLWGGT